MKDKMTKTWIESKRAFLNLTSHLPLFLYFDKLGVKLRDWTIRNLESSERNLFFLLTRVRPDRSIWNLEGETSPELSLSMKWKTNPLDLDLKLNPILSNFRFSRSFLIEPITLTTFLIEWLHEFCNDHNAHFPKRASLTLLYGDR